MKEILISIKPEWVAKILNGTKTIEVRKTKPNCELPIRVYIYCCKSNEKVLDVEFNDKKPNWFCWDKKAHHYPFRYENNFDEHFNGHILGYFTLEKVEEIPPLCLISSKDLNAMQLTWEELDFYLKDKVGYSWHISNIYIYNVFKVELELKDFGLKKAPQSWCYIGSKK